MLNFILFDDMSRNKLRPFTFLRPVSSIRVGILTIAEKWNIFLQSETSYLTEPFLQEKYRIKVSLDNILINGSILPDTNLVSEILELQPDHALMKDGLLVAIRLTSENLKFFAEGNPNKVTNIEYRNTLNQISNTWDIISYNKKSIQDDFEMLTAGRVSQPLSKSNSLIGNSIFLEDGCSIECALIDTRQGPVYVGKNAVIMPGAMIEGVTAIGENATVKMGAQLYSGTSIGPWCKAGGEISNSVLTAFSAKAHDGYLGDSVIGEWCNLGAGTITSNLKNNYETVKQWSYADHRFVETGMQFCGLVMGDHSKSGINTNFNSGTTTGICSNIFGTSYQRNFIASFAWGGTSGFRKHKLSEVLSTAKSVFARRHLEFSKVDENIITHVFNITLNDKYL